MDDSFSALARQYRNRLVLCKQLEEKGCFLRQRMVQLRGTDNTHTRAVVPLLNTQMRQIAQRIRQEDSRMAADATAISNRISELHDERLRQILRYRYLELMAWGEISDITGLGLRWLHRLHKKGLDKIV